MKNRKPSPDSFSEGSCKYYLVTDSERILLGETEIPKGQDMDDAFPVFHSKNFPRDHFHSLVEAIQQGAKLIAEPSVAGGQYRAWLLAYIDEDPNLWLGRESTLSYFGVTEFKSAS